MKSKKILLISKKSKKFKSFKNKDMRRVLNETLIYYKTVSFMKVIQTAGYRVCLARIQIDDVERAISKIGRQLQVVNADCWEQVAFATILALKSFGRGTNHARTVNGEILLRLAGTLQIADAIKEYGVKAGENFVVAYGEGCEKRIEELLEELKTRELPLEECQNENMKSLFEKAALVEVL